MSKKPRYKDSKVQRNQQDKVASLDKFREQEAQKRVAEVVAQTDGRVQMIENLASRLTRIVPEMMIEMYPAQGKGLDMQLVTAALVSSAGRLLSQYCPEEHQAEAGALLVDWLGRAIVGDAAMEEAQAAVQDKGEKDAELEASKILIP